jgi:hypothetical protein
MSERVKSAYCQVCGEQRKLTKDVKEGSKSNKWLLKEGYKTNNPLAFALFLPYLLIRFIFRMVGAVSRLAFGGTPYRCVVCGSKEGAQPAIPAT